MGVGNTLFRALWPGEERDRNYRASKIGREFSEMEACSAQLFVGYWSAGCWDVVSLRMRWGRKERSPRQDCDMAMDGGRRSLRNEALSGGVEQSTYLFVVVVGRDSFCVVVCLMRRQAREEVSALQGEVQSQASPKPARCQRGGRDPCSATKNNFVARLYVLVTVANYL